MEYYNGEDEEGNKICYLEKYLWIISENQVIFGKNVIDNKYWYLNFYFNYINRNDINYDDSSEYMDPIDGNIIAIYDNTIQFDYPDENIIDIIFLDIENKIIPLYYIVCYGCVINLSLLASDPIIL